MPRTARLDSTGVLHHVMIGGIEKTRSLLCYWASRELGISHTELAKRFELSLAAIGFSVERGELIAKEGKYILEK